MPEARILARQMRAAIVGKTVAGFELRGCESLQRLGFVNRDPEAFGRLAGETVQAVVSRGNTMLVKLTGDQNLILSPEYGGEIFLHENARSFSGKYHLRLDFADGSALTVRLTGMGGVYACSEEGLTAHYLVRRDFDPDRPEPDDLDLTPGRFAEWLAAAGRQLKPVLVGKDALVVGLSNSAFQDMIHRAGLHPKRRAADLGPDQRRALYDAMRLVVSERLRLGGKSQFRDLFGRPGCYEPAMGPALRGRPCPVCGTAVQKLSLGGGDVFVCPRCQPAPE